MVGRTKGYRKPKENYVKEYHYELRLLASGLSLKIVSKITGRSVNTLRKLKNFI